MVLNFNFYCGAAAKIFIGVEIRWANGAKKSALIVNIIKKAPNELAHGIDPKKNSHFSCEGFGFL